MRRQTFFVGGSYAGPETARVMQGQMCVESLCPDAVTQLCPLVMIHGGGQTATNWLTTPDGRPGWAPWFAEHGWHVYLVDQPGRGRSAWQPGLDAPLKPTALHLIERFFTAPAAFNLWPQARLHTQWPGGPSKGRAGDPVFDQFFASQVPSLPRSESEQAMRAAGAALLDRIGPCVLLVHSQAGLFAWLIADACPGLVKGVVALEPSGPPFKDSAGKPGAEDRVFGLTGERLTYDPPVTEQSPLSFVEATEVESPDLARCWSQAGTPRRLVHLADVPTVIVTAEASYHAMFDHCTVNYLRQAGVAADFIRLEEAGLRGNGHMMMLEENSAEIAALVHDWMMSNVARSDWRVPLLSS